MGSERLAGQVLLQNGAPGSGIEVFLFVAEPEPGAATPLHWKLTDAEGSFEFDQLQERRYGVILFAPGRKPEEREVAVPLESDVTWRLAELALPDIDPLPELTRADLTGRVEILPDHADVARLSPVGYEVALIPALDDPMLLTGALRRRAEVAPDGSFVFESVVTAEYQLELLPPWAKSGTWPVIDRFSISHRESGSATAVLRIRSGSVEGQLLDLEGREVEGALVLAWPEGTPGRLWPAQSTDEEGRFRIESLPPGSYRVRVRAGAGVQDALVTVLEGVSHKLELLPTDPRRPADD